MRHLSESYRITLGICQKWPIENVSPLVNRVSHIVRIEKLTTPLCYIAKPSLLVVLSHLHMHIK